MKIKKEQQRIEMVLSGKKIEFEKVDISLVEGAKEKMREICGEGTLPPQLCKGDTYLGVSLRMLLCYLFSLLLFVIQKQKQHQGIQRLHSGVSLPTKVNK